MAPGNVIRISGDWRAPAAIVEQGDGIYLVGLDAVRMRLPASAAPPVDYLTISNPYMQPPGYNELWTGGDVEDALLLLSYLADAARTGKGFRREDLEQIAGRGPAPVRRDRGAVDAPEDPSRRDAGLGLGAAW